MRKLAYLFIGILFILPIISFAADDNGGLFSFLNFISEQLQILKERIIKLIKNIRNVSPELEEVLPSEPIVDKKDKKQVAPAPQPLKKEIPVSIPAPISPPVISQPAPEPPKIEVPKLSQSPSIDLKADGSDGPIMIIKGNTATLSWDLSGHNWSYCGRSGSWDGTLPVEDGSQNTESLLYNKTYNLFCYIGSTKYEDSVTVIVTSPIEQIATTSLSKPTFSITDPGFKTCSLEVSRNTVTMGKDALEATWVIDSDPRSAYFYWRGKDNGVDIGKVYGGKTQRIRIFDYGAYPAKYERYVEMFFSQNHYVGDPYTPGCTTNTIVFEVKQ